MWLCVGCLGGGIEWWRSLFFVAGLGECGLTVD